MDVKDCSGSSLYRLFNPRGIAIIGASENSKKIGYKVLHNIVNGGFKGGIYPVNPSGGKILGKKVYESIAELPDDVDSAVICVPAKYVIQRRGDGGQGDPFRYNDNRRVQGDR
jgi:acetate---CoA ligase (ADP-forming) subunit alpha